MDLYTYIVVIDFRKAFDTVNLNILLQKFQASGILDEELEWFKNYLQCKKQTAYANGFESRKLDVTREGAIRYKARPQFILTYANDVSKVIQQSELLLFADDTAVYCQWVV